MRRMLTRDAVREARALGLQVRMDGGEVIVTLPGVRTVRASVPSRKKDSSPALVKLLEVAMGRRER